MISEVLPFQSKQVIIDSVNVGLVNRKKLNMSLELSDNNSPPIRKEINIVFLSDEEFDRYEKSLQDKNLSDKT
jgi:hypothetical protein